MPKPTRNQITSYRQFERRQRIYEKRYLKAFLTYLSVSYKDAAKNIKENGVQAFNFTEISNNGKLEKILTKLYKDVSLKEAIISYKEVLEPVEGNRLVAKDSGEDIQTKDVIDDLINILSPNNRGLINLWQSMLNNFLQVRLTNRITRINNTTNERISRIIENGIFKGKGAIEVAKDIRAESRGKFNVNRSRSIARTETITAANQGKFMSAESSNLRMKKKWIPAKDNRTRRSHKDMLNREWIPLQDKFWLANDEGLLEEALYPGDETLSASNVINCRCSLIFEPMRDDTGSLIRKS